MCHMLCILSQSTPFVEFGKCGEDIFPLHKRFPAILKWVSGFQ